jgi:hypothetical protein
VPKSFSGQTTALAPALVAVRAAITILSLACDPRRGIEETAQANGTILHRGRDLGKAMGLSREREK